MTTCSQCGNPAVTKIGDVDVCVDCYVRFEDAATKRQLVDQQHIAQLMAMTNYTTDYMWAQIGLRSPNRIEVPPLVSSLGDNMVTNTFNIHGSTIGLLSAGQNNSLRNLAVHLQLLQAPEQRSVAEAIRTLVEAVVKSGDLGDTAKTQALEQLEELASQAQRPPEQRSKPSTLSLVLNSVQSALAAGGALAEIWGTWGPQIRTYFGL